MNTAPPESPDAGAAAPDRPAHEPGPMPGGPGDGATTTPRRASAAFARAHPAHFIALGLGSGLSPVAPGTIGTLWAWLAFVAADIVWQPGDAGWALALALALPLAWWSATVTAGRLGQADPSAIVIDEIAAFWLVLWLIAPANLAQQAAAFVLFRFFDAVKPGPVGWADRAFHGRGWRGGFGILFDDLVAAFCTLLVIALWRAL